MSMPTENKGNISVSFDAVYQEYATMVYNIAFRMSGSEETALDISQEVFIILYTALPTFRGESKLSTWIYKIAKTTAIRFISRTMKKDFRMYESIIREFGIVRDTTERDPIELHYYITQVKTGCLFGLLHCLPFHQRLAFILSVIVGLPMREVADVIEKSENAARVLVHRARKSSIRGETVCLSVDPAVGYSIWETENSEEFERKFALWKAFYSETEVQELISPAESMEKLFKYVK